MNRNDNEHCRLRRSVRQGRSVTALLPIMAAVFVAYLVIGLAMPVVPLHVHQGLGLGTFFVGHLPDRIGGAVVALVRVLIEVAGQALIWLAPWTALALVGAALTCCGYPLVYPGFGVVAVRRAPPESRGLRGGGLRRLSRPGAGARQPAARADREQGGLKRGVLREHPRRALRRGYRIASSLCARSSDNAAGLRGLQTMSRELNDRRST